MIYLTAHRVSDTSLTSDICVLILHVDIINEVQN